MKRIGIIGGMSYQSTLYYYDQINHLVNERMGGMSSADLIIKSVNYEEYCELMDKDQWARIREKLAHGAKDLAYDLGCDYIAMATNTMHKVAPEVKKRVERCYGNYGNYPKFIHIGDCIAEHLRQMKARRIMLLGTEFIVTDGFMKRFLSGKYNIEVVGMRDYCHEICNIDRIILEELRHDIVNPESKKYIQDFVYRFYWESRFKPEAVVLCSTELNRLIKPGDIYLPLVDSAKAHAEKLVELSLK